MAHINATRRLRDLRPEVLQRYNLSGPRYTSYPTAPTWSEATGHAELHAHLEASREASAGRPLSLYTHLPFCISHCTFCGCNVIISPKRELVSEPYVRVLEREIELYARALNAEREVVQLHWGGGTPTYLSAEQLRRVHGMIAKRITFATGAEKALEIHVNWTSDEQMHVLAELGFNRISMGVQDFDPRTQAAVNRIQSFERTQELVRLARTLGFGGINLDLIYGLPHQSVGSFARTVDQILELRPDRLAVYNFAYLPERMRHQAVIDPETLPAPEEKFRIFLETHDRLTAAGYRYIGMDHFALPNDELAIAFDAGTMQRNFMGFTTRAGADLVGMGISSIGLIDGMFVQNTKKIPAWERALEAGEFPTERGLKMSAEDALRGEVIMSLMCRDHVDKRGIEAKFGVVFDEVFGEELERLEAMGMIEDELLTVSGEGLDLTFLGRMFVRNIAMVFDGYLGEERKGKRVMFSKTL